MVISVPAARSQLDGCDCAVTAVIVFALSWVEEDAGFCLQFGIRGQSCGLGDSG